jgi:hypothetical protein
VVRKKWKWPIETLRTTNHSFILFLLEEWETKASFGFKKKGHLFSFLLAHHLSIIENEHHVITWITIVTIVALIFTYSYDTTQVHQLRKMKMKQCVIPFVKTSD